MVAQGEPTPPLADPLLQLRFGISNTPVHALASHATALLAPCLAHLSSVLRQTTLWYTTRMTSLDVKPELPAMVAHQIAATCRHAPPLLIMAGFALTAYSIMNSHLKHRPRALRAPVPDAQPAAHQLLRIAERTQWKADKTTSTPPSPASPQPWHALHPDQHRPTSTSPDHGHLHTSRIVETTPRPPVCTRHVHKLAPRKGSGHGLHSFYPGGGSW